mmetsp:Transcript_598/g.1225  ORF Transcript_598/g.1225 Transcript_598/m.1225 type:complete len:566 (-) Transcript_598:850-2547(-)
MLHHHVPIHHQDGRVDVGLPVHDSLHLAVAVLQVVLQRCAGSQRLDENVLGGCRYRVGRGQLDAVPVQRGLVVACVDVVGELLQHDLPLQCELCLFPEVKLVEDGGLHGFQDLPHHCEGCIQLVLEVGEELLQEVPVVGVGLLRLLEHGLHDHRLPMAAWHQSHELLPHRGVDVIPHREEVHLPHRAGAQRLGVLQDVQQGHVLAETRHCHGGVVHSHVLHGARFIPRGVGILRLLQLVPHKVVLHQVRSHGQILRHLGKEAPHLEDLIQHLLRTNQLDLQVLGVGGRLHHQEELRDPSQQNGGPLQHVLDLFVGEVVQGLYALLLLLLASSPPVVAFADPFRHSVPHMAHALVVVQLVHQPLGGPQLLHGPRVSVPKGAEPDRAVVAGLCQGLHRALAHFAHHLLLNGILSLLGVGVAARRLQCHGPGPVRGRLRARDEGVVHQLGDPLALSLVDHFVPRTDLGAHALQAEEGLLDEVGFPKLCFHIVVAVVLQMSELAGGPADRVLLRGEVPVLLAAALVQAQIQKRREVRLLEDLADSHRRFPIVPVGALLVLDHAWLDQFQ